MTEAKFDAAAVRETYDAVADEYAAAFAGDLDQLEFDRDFLISALALAPSDGVVVDVGCGPGQVLAFVASRRSGVVGVDLSTAMLSVARRRGVDHPLVGGDMRALPIAAESSAAVMAFYSLQYLAPPETPGVLAEFQRVLVPGGVFVLAVHLGDEMITGPDEWFGKAVPRVDAVLHPEAWWVDTLSAAGFTLESKCHRDHLPHEAPTTRLYAIARAR